MTNIIAMSIYSLTMSISPGPVNLVSLSASLRYGFKKTFPFVSGATIGFTLLLTASGIGIHNLVEYFDYFYDILKYLGAAFIAYMGYKTLRSHSEIEIAEQKLPNFVHGFLMQWLNPKAWIAAVSGVSIFNEKHSFTTLLLFVSVYFVICYVSMSTWTLLGSKLKLILRSRRIVRILYIAMGVVLILISIYIVALH